MSSIKQVTDELQPLNPNGSAGVLNRTSGVPADVTTEKPPKPPRLALNTDNIPDELKALAQWLVWRWTWNDKAGKWDKPPRNAQTGALGSSTDPATWSTFEQALTAYNTGKFDGLGFTITADGEYSGIDLDNCIAESANGEIIMQPWAYDITEALNSYAELSPSGTGVKLWIKGKVPADHRSNRGGLGIDGTGKVEVFSDGRYFTITGRVINLTGTGPLPIEERQEQLNALCARYLQRDKPKATAPRPAAIPCSIGERELLDKARNAKNGAEFSRLYDYGDMSEYSGDHSAADLACCSHLAFWANGDAGMMDKLFRGSKLMRDKWDEVHRADGATYGQMTIEEALSGFTEGYDPTPAILRRSLNGGATHTSAATRPAIVGQEPTEAPALEEQEPPRPRFRLIETEELKNRPNPEPLLEGILYKNTLAAIVAASESFKSFIALSIAGAIARGSRWHGHETEKAGVVYVSAEGSGGLKLRVQAEEIRAGRALPAYFLTEAVQLLQAADVVQFIDAINELPERPGLIVIDTLARCLVGGDENSAKDMGLFIAGCDRIRQETGATVLIIHHVGKSGDTRGSTALPGAMDTIITVKRENDRVKVECGKQKDAEHFKPLQLIKRVVELPEYETSLVFDLDTSAPADGTGKADRVKEQMLEILKTQFPDGARPKAWQEACENAKLGKYRTFYNHVEQMTGEQIEKRGGLWFVKGSASTANAQENAQPPESAETSEITESATCAESANSANALQMHKNAQLEIVQENSANHSLYRESCTTCTNGVPELEDSFGCGDRNSLPDAAENDPEPGPDAAADGEEEAEF